MLMDDHSKATVPPSGVGRILSGVGMGGIRLRVGTGNTHPNIKAKNVQKLTIFMPYPF